MEWHWCPVSWVPSPERTVSGNWIQKWMGISEESGEPKFCPLLIPKFHKILKGSPLQISDGYVVTYDVKTYAGRWEEHCQVGTFRACTFWLLPISQRLKNGDRRVVFCNICILKLTELSLKCASWFLSAATKIWSLYWQLVVGTLALRSKSFRGQKNESGVKERNLKLEWGNKIPVGRWKWMFQGKEASS